MVDVSDAVDQADDFSFECPRVLQPAVVEDPVSNLRCEVEATPVALEQFHDSERLLVVAEMPAEALVEDLVEDLFTCVP